MTTDARARRVPAVRGEPRRVDAVVVRGHDVIGRDEPLSGEEPLQIRAAGPGQAPTDVAVTMRTPGGEDELAVGFLVSEGLVAPGDAASAGFELGDPARIAQPEDEILVRLRVPLDVDVVAERHFIVTASCGICGRASIDELTARVAILPAGASMQRAVLEALPERMRSAQASFEVTGGLHAAALFAAGGEMIALREDIGRHNAVDKVVGSQALVGRLPLTGTVLLVSGRTSFEIVQKAATAGVAILAAVSAPSDLAVETAQRLGMTLVGFLRGDGFNIYSHPSRIVLDDD